MASSLAESALLPLQLRLRGLEAQILGVPASFADEIAHPKDTKTVTRRVAEIQDRLERSAEGNEALKRLVSGYQQYLPLLTLPGDTQAQAKDVLDDAGTTTISKAEQAQTTESDLLPDQVKLAMVLEAAGDVRSAERDLREIELLHARGVEGAGTLEALLLFKGDLAQGMRRAETRGKGLDGARKEVGELLLRYNAFTSTVSDLFIDLHHRLENMEEVVARAERTRRKELASRF